MRKIHLLYGIVVLRKGAFIRFCTVFEEIQQIFRVIPSGAQANKTRTEKRDLLVPRIQKFNDLIHLTV